MCVARQRERSSGCGRRSPADSSTSTEYLERVVALHERWHCPVASGVSSAIQRAIRRHASICRNSNATKSSRRPLGERGCERGSVHRCLPNLATATNLPPSSHSSFLDQGSLSINPASLAEASAFHFRSAGRREVHRSRHFITRLHVNLNEAGSIWTQLMNNSSSGYLGTIDPKLQCSRELSAEILAS